MDPKVYEALVRAAQISGTHIQMFVKRGEINPNQAVFCMAGFTVMMDHMCKEIQKDFPSFDADKFISEVTNGAVTSFPEVASVTPPTGVPTPEELEKKIKQMLNNSEEESDEESNVIPFGPGNSGTFH
jgi:hypothetical protein